MNKSKVAIVLFVFALSAGLASAQETTRNWNFSVLLDGSKIGYHTFQVTEMDGSREVRSKASFDVKFFFINAFRYRHENTERWVDDCLLEIESYTNSNGKKFNITGSKTEYGFYVDSGPIDFDLPECVMTFAYWNPDFLQQKRLLNPQSGEYLDVRVEELEPQAIAVRGQEVDARVYSVKAKAMELKLWYSDNDEWLALESLAKGGRVIRYELS